MKIAKLTLYTSNLPAVKDFYGNILSLKITAEDENQISFNAGSSELIFKKELNNVNPFYHFAFIIPANKLEEAKEWMAGKTELLPISENNFIADFINWNAKSIYFLDPAGNIVEFIARFDLKNSAAEKFDSAQILNISEMGVVTGNVLKFRQKLIDEYKVFDFIKSVNSDSFAAMGDDNGLFIVASENRNWYPTNIPSLKFPFEIKFANDSGKSFTIK